MFMSFLNFVAFGIFVTLGILAVCGAFYVLLKALAWAEDTPTYRRVRSLWNRPSIGSSETPRR